jgi:hypothetical protein
MQSAEGWLEKLRRASVSERETIKQALRELATGPDGAAVRDFLDSARRGELLEVQWEIEEVLEAVTPKAPEPSTPPAAAATPAPAPAPAEEPPAPAGPRPLSMKDLVTVYDDPRGLMLHTSKGGDRWFATQADPYSGQPQTFELRAAEVTQLKAQLARSPYWVLGSGGPAGPAGAGGPSGTGA